MRTILKSNIDPATTGCDQHIITAGWPQNNPGGVFVGCQDGRLMLWYEVGTEIGPTERRFQIYGTGQPVDGKRDYIGSAVCGHFVWHVYEVVA